MACPAASLTLVDNKMQQNEVLRSHSGWRELTVLLIGDG